MMSLRRRKLAGFAAAVAAPSALLAAACIIADPPTELPKPRRPIILRDHPIVPPNTAVLGVFPKEFLIDVEVDPSQPVEWRLFVDYDPVNGTGYVSNGKVLPDPGAPDSPVRTLSLVDPMTPPSLSTCHVIEGLVAFGYSSQPGVGGVGGVHTFGPGGGDSIVWLYSPTGDLSGCPIYDAGAVDGAFPESGGPLVIPDGGTE